MPTKLEVTFAEIQAEANSQAPRAAVLAVSPKIQTSFSSPAAVVTAVRLRTGVDYVDLRSSISYVAMEATDIILAPHLLTLVYDTISFVDNVSFRFDYGFTLVDTATLTDVTVKSIGKAPTDSFSFADAIVVAWTPLRTFAETASVSDGISIAGSTTRSDSLTTTDVLVVSTGLACSDSVSATDSAAKSVGKAASDTCSLTDVPVLAVSKALAETLSMSDNVVVMNFSIESSKLNHSVLGTFSLNQ